MCVCVCEGERETGVVSVLLQVHKSNYVKVEFISQLC